MHFQKVKPFNFAILVTILISLSLIAQPFADLKNGTIKDTNTGLIWEKCSAGQNWEKNCEGDSTMMNWESAMNYCKDLKLAEMEWKLPSYKEMRTILSLENSGKGFGATQYKPAISLTFFPNTEHGYYFTGWRMNTLRPKQIHLIKDLLTMLVLILCHLIWKMNCPHFLPQKPQKCLSAA